jgi:hypothetical protein
MSPSRRHEASRAISRGTHTRARTKESAMLRILPRLYALTVDVVLVGSFLLSTGFAGAF